QRTSAILRITEVLRFAQELKRRPGFPGRLLCLSPFQEGESYRSRVRTDCGIWLACARMAVPACWRIWDFVKLTITSDMSASRVRLSEAARFSCGTPRLAIVCSSRFWKAPRLERLPDTVTMAVLTVVMSALAFAWVEASGEPMPSEVA